MATQHIDAEEAFTRLVSMSQSAHVKIRDLAPRVVEQSLRSWTRDGA
jgi:AmiR/NasT family two-component response regulator